MKTTRMFTVFVRVMIPLFCALPFACGSMDSLSGIGGSVAGLGKKIAGKAEIDQNTKTAISMSTKAVANAAEEITPEQEYYIGRAVAANILKTYSLWNGNSALTAYANRICNTIVINSPRPDLFNGYHVALLNSNEINAFATSGGHIFLTRGLVASAKSEDALAGVIAHEIAHIQLQHSIKAIRTSRITQALMVTGASAAGAVSGYDVKEMTGIFNETVGDIVGTLVNNGYSQVQEYDADKTAMSLLAGAGYNPSGLIEMLRELEKTQKGQSGGFNKTHPSPEARRSIAEKAISLQPKINDTSSYRRKRFTAVNK
jgi:predicted Zn-dependent protease